MSAKRGTYLVEFTDGTQIVCGNNYKAWSTHAVEYAWSKFQDRKPHDALLEFVKLSDTPFVDNGGLKWASPEGYQEVIDEMEIKDSKPRTHFRDIEFNYSRTDRRKLEKELKYWGLI